MDPNDFDFSPPEGGPAEERLDPCYRPAYFRWPFKAGAEEVLEADFRALCERNLKATRRDELRALLSVATVQGRDAIPGSVRIRGLAVEVNGGSSAHPNYPCYVLKDGLTNEHWVEIGSQTATPAVSEEEAGEGTELWDVCMRRSGKRIARISLPAGASEPGWVERYALEPTVLDWFHHRTVAALQCLFLTHAEEFQAAGLRPDQPICTHSYDLEDKIIVVNESAPASFDGSVPVSVRGRPVGEVLFEADPPTWDVVFNYPSWQEIVSRVQDFARTYMLTTDGAGTTIVRFRNAGIETVADLNTCEFVAHEDEFGYPSVDIRPPERRPHRRGAGSAAPLSGDSDYTKTRPRGAATTTSTINSRRDLPRVKRTRKPTVEELEALLNTEEEVQLDVYPNAELREREG